MPDVTVDHRVKPGGDAVGSVWSILYAKFGSPNHLGAPQDEPEIYAALRRGVSVPIQQLPQLRRVRNGDCRMLKRAAYFVAFLAALTAAASVGWAKARSAVPTRSVPEASR
jgi:hypothetical protein